jgi:hypothetical protein
MRMQRASESDSRASEKDVLAARSMAGRRRLASHHQNDTGAFTQQQALLLDSLLLLMILRRVAANGAPSASRGPAPRFSLGDDEDDESCLGDSADAGARKQATALNPQRPASTHGHHDHDGGPFRHQCARRGAYERYPAAANKASATHAAACSKSRRPLVGSWGWQSGTARVDPSHKGGPCATHHASVRRRCFGS